LIVWIDAQLPPSLAEWLGNRFGVEATPVSKLDLRDASDETIFHTAKARGAVVITKDLDFVRLLSQHGPPPQVLWVTSGNTSNARLREILERTWRDAEALLVAGEPLVEIRS
jgi:predicted nuclease of predicted toxin-antitoxin system